MLYRLLLPEGSNGIPCATQGMRERGPFSHVREWPPLDPPRERKGPCPLTPHIGSQALEELRSLRIALRCTWLRHEPLRFVACCNRALLREARVTLPRRRTACRMRHCYARRIDETGGKRKLVSTPTRSAERQRIIEAEANRIVKPMAASVSNAATQALSLRRHESCSSSRLPIKAFLLGVKGGYSLSVEREYPP